MTEPATDRPFFVHSKALCESQEIGRGTKIWAFAHVMEGARVGELCNLCDHVFVESGAVIGHRVTVKNGVLIWKGIHIEDDVFVGPGVTFTNDRFPRSPRMSGVPDVARRYRHQENWLEPTWVARGASIGAGAVIMCGITIGQFALVAAGAVVIKDVPAHGLVMGNPARPRGWVCWCGRRLEANGLHPSDGRERLVCRPCGTSFVLDEGGSMQEGE